MTDWASRATAFAYDADSDLVSTSFPNGDSVAVAVDRSGASESSVLSGPGSAGTLASLTYGRDGAGQLASQSGAGLGQPAESYGYTALEQLSTVNGSAAFSYDAADDLVRLRGATQAFDVANELTSSTPDGGSATTYGYDARGGRVSATPPVGGGPAVAYGWDQARRLKSASSGGGASYAYDGDGLRMSKTVGGSATAFAWDLSGGLPLAVRDGATSVVYGPGGLPLEQVAADGTAQWFFHDQLGSTRALTDSAGAVAGAWSYDPYGAVISSSGTATTHFGFAGEYTDAETGFVYLRARYYDPATGQFLSRDPLVAFTQSPTATWAVAPLDRRDPTGLFNCWRNSEADDWHCADDPGVAAARWASVSSMAGIAEDCTSLRTKQCIIGLLSLAPKIPFTILATAMDAISADEHIHEEDDPEVEKATQQDSCVHHTARRVPQMLGSRLRSSGVSRASS